MHQDRKTAVNHRRTVPWLTEASRRPFAGLLLYQHAGWTGREGAGQSHALSGPSAEIRSLVTARGLPGSAPRTAVHTRAAATTPTWRRTASSKAR
ncbi:hypothetical protein GCM10020229_27460 [Kitasatospora albolonga]